jgi:hypothetical protein
MVASDRSREDYAMSNDEGERPADQPTEPVPPTAPVPEPAPAPADPGVPPPPRPGRGPRIRSVITSRVAGWVVATALAGAVVALSVTWAGTRHGEIGLPFRPGAERITLVGPGQELLGPRGPLARHVAPLMPGVRGQGGEFVVPFGLVVTGTVGSVASSSFTISTPGGKTLTIDEQSATVYRSAGRPAASSIVKNGARVAVLGSASGSKISATEVVVLPASGSPIVVLPG